MCVYFLSLVYAAVWYANDVVFWSRVVKQLFFQQYYFNAISWLYPNPWGFRKHFNATTMLEWPESILNYILNR